MNYFRYSFFKVINLYEVIAFVSLFTYHSVSNKLSISTSISHDGIMNIQPVQNANGVVILSQIVSNCEGLYSNIFYCKCYEGGNILFVAELQKRNVKF